MSLERCEVCGGGNVTYAAFSGGREYYCRDCESNHPYPEEQLPPRLKLLREGRTDELRAQMRAELTREPATAVEAIGTYYRWLQAEELEVVAPDGQLAKLITALEVPDDDDDDNEEDDR